MGVHAMPSWTCGGGAGGSEGGGSEGGDGKGDGGARVAEARGWGGGGGGNSEYLGVLFLLCFKGKLDEVLLQLLVGVVDAQLLKRS